MSSRLRWLCLAVVLCSATPLRAQDADPIAQGVALRRQGKNAEALEVFRRAYERDPSPRALAQIALAQQALGNWVAAESGLVEALATRDDAWIQRSASALEAALATVRDHLASLYVDTDTPGATILVAGREAGKAPLTAAIRVASGDTWIELRAPGHETQSQALHLPPRSEQRVRVDLPRLPELPAPAVAPAPIVAKPPPPPPPAPRSHGSAQQTAGIVTLVAGGVFLAGAITANIVRAVHVSKHNDPEFCTPTTDCTAYADVANTAGTLMVIGYSVAGAAVLTGVILLVTAPRADRGPLQLTLSPHGAGASFRAVW
ncbi:MAG TPA: PEGA domain-containing protein [Polyangiales bacterium]|nr:PEGA domain-containing protein [Polyangiales bacterium]